LVILIKHFIETISSSINNYYFGLIIIRLFFLVYLNLQLRKRELSLQLLMDDLKLTSYINHRIIFIPFYLFIFWQQWQQH